MNSSLAEYSFEERRVKLQDGHWMPMTKMLAAELIESFANNKYSNGMIGAQLNGESNAQDALTAWPEVWEILKTAPAMKLYLAKYPDNRQAEARLFRMMTKNG